LATEGKGVAYKCYQQRKDERGRKNEVMKRIEPASSTDNYDVAGERVN
jgi:hypothetical protein